MGANSVPAAERTMSGQEKVGGRSGLAGTGHVRLAAFRLGCAE